MQRVRVAALVIVIGALHVAGFAALAAGFVSVGLGLTAYTLGARHAFDADHIAAIDGTTRKLMARGERPVSVGFFFALGHATVPYSKKYWLASPCGSISAFSSVEVGSMFCEESELINGAPGFSGTNTSTRSNL